MKKNKTIHHVAEISDQCIAIRDKKHEYVIAFLLNANHQLIGKEIISVGTTTASLAHPREIFGAALRHEAHSIILSHNHPSGDPRPSEEDVRLTKRLAQAGQIMGIELMDHLIIGTAGSFSFKTAGLL